MYDFANQITHDAAGDSHALRERHIELIEDTARERAAEMFNEGDYNALAFLTDEIPARDAMVYALNSTDACAVGESIIKAFNAARDAWVNKNWNRLANHYCDFAEWPRALR